MSILLTGGAGYIGSHIAVELLAEGQEVVILDNLSNSSEIVIDRIEKISGKKVKFYKGDIRIEKDLEEVFKFENIDTVIHLAGLKAVGESVRIPLDYYENNVGGTVNLCKVMQKYNVKNIIFSSSATVYGVPNEIPITENTPKSRCTNPYGWTKWIIEEILLDLYNSDKSWNIITLRYFNPIGAHESGLIGESPKGIPNNLTPYITQVLVGKLDKLIVFGDDYETHDGTGVRDYIHIVDLAIGHVKALDVIKKGIGVATFNLGTGNGYSVLDVVKAFEKATSKEVPFEIRSRRPGDIATSYCDATKAKEDMGWEAKKTIDDMCKDAWRWQKNNQQGYES